MKQVKHTVATTWGPDFPFPSGFRHSDTWFGKAVMAVRPPFQGPFPQRTVVPRIQTGKKEVGQNLTNVTVA